MQESIGPWQARPECNRRRWWPTPVESSQALLKHSESEAGKVPEEDQIIKVEATLSV